MSGGAEFDVKAELDGVHALFQRYQRAGGDLSETMKVVADMLVLAVDDEFETAGHGKWPPLALSTLAKRRKKGSGAQILKDSGELAGNIHADSGPDWAEASSDKDYAVYHVSDAPRTKIPLRNFFDIPEEVLDRATVIVVNDIARMLESGAGKGA